MHPSVNAILSTLDLFSTWIDENSIDRDAGFQYIELIKKQVTGAVEVNALVSVPQKHSLHK